MKKDKETLVLYLVSIIMQCIFFSEFCGVQSPFPFLLGVNIGEGVIRLSHLEAGALCLPITLLTLYFSDYYSFHMESFGKLLLVRNCNILKLLFNMGAKMVLEFALLVSVQWLINAIWFYDFLKRELCIILAAGYVYCIVMITMLLIEFYLCSLMQNHIAHMIINIYIYISFYLGCYVDDAILKVIFFPRRLIKLKEDLQIMGVGKILCSETLYGIIIVMVVSFLIINRCRKKDYF